MRKLRLILGDQLNTKHSWYNDDGDLLYCMMEMKQETDHTKLHIQKVIGFFMAMRAFKDHLEERDHKVHYIHINDEDNTHDLEKNIKALIDENNIECFEYQEPDAFRLDQQLKSLCNDLDIETNCVSTEHFITERGDLGEFYEGKKQYLMESFYRDMRKKHNILMKSGNPEGGDWNYDKSNRKKYKGEVEIPKYREFRNEAEDINKEIEEAGIKTFGNFEGPYFEYPINREQALTQLNYFCSELLPHFGDYQDAMLEDEAYLFHSRISFALNAKILSPMEVIEKSIEAYEADKELIDISQVEGFVRQILGWREYMRGMYWEFMPEYKEKNELNNSNPLPDMYWTADTKMNCMKHSVQNTLDNAYAHHIQRLMILGNFSLMMQTDPDEIDAWFLGAYVDAIEWVQLPNTRGMSQFADGGLIATKPYISSANYVNKMSDYCSGCSYDHKEKVGENACPMNSLYWNFLDDKKEELSNNHRMGMMYSLLGKKSSEELHKIKERAAQIMENPNDY